MIIIPEIETVAVLVPRTGSGSLRRAIAAAYPRAFMVYRHMEADGVPLGYDRWRRIGVVRHPVHRLWSLYKFLKKFDEDGRHDSAYSEAMRRSVRRPFSEWLVRNEVVFTSPYDRAGNGRYFPQYSVRHPIPENRKSQFVYLRPDLGTQVFKYSNLGALELAIGVQLTSMENYTANDNCPPLTSVAAEYVRRVFAWDLSAVGDARPEAVAC